MRFEKTQQLFLAHAITFRYHSWQKQMQQLQLSTCSLAIMEFLQS